MQSRDVNAATLLVEASWRLDKDKWWVVKSIESSAWPQLPWILQPTMHISIVNV